MSAELSNAQVAALIANLCEYFALPMPTICQMHMKRGVSTYRPVSRLITIATNSHFTREQATLHEFAHYLQHQRLGRDVCQRGFRWHGPTFFRALVQTVTYHFGEPRKYCWAIEYKSLVRLAKARGWC